MKLLLPFSLSLMLLQESRAVCTRTVVFGGTPTLGVPPGVRW